MKHTTVLILSNRTSTELEQITTQCTFHPTHSVAKLTLTQEEGASTKTPPRARTTTTRTRPRLVNNNTSDTARTKTPRRLTLALLLTKCGKAVRIHDERSGFIPWIVAPGSAAQTPPAQCLRLRRTCRDQCRPGVSSSCVGARAWQLDLAGHGNRRTVCS